MVEQTKLNPTRFPYDMSNKRASKLAPTED